MILPFLQQAAAAPEIEDIKGIVMLEPEPSIWGIIWVILGILLFLTLVGFLTWFLIQKYSGKGAGMLPEFQAMKKLQHLQRNSAAMRPNKLSLEVSETLKDFLIAKFNDPIRYETADEFLHRFSSSPNPPSAVPVTVHQDLKSFIRMSEEMKFGNAPDAEKRTASLFQLAHNVVNLSRIETTQKPSSD